MAFHGATETSHIGIHVTDLERSLAFYRDRLGFEVVDVTRVDSHHAGEILGREGVEADRALLRLPLSPAYLELLQYDASVQGEPVDPLHGNVGTFHIAFYTHDLESLWASLAEGGSELQSRDGTITKIEGGVFDGGSVIYCTDPDGVRVEFLCGPAYLDGSYRDAGAVPDDRPANETSHAGIHVSDLERSCAFWVDTLGFEVVAKWVADDAGTRHVIGEPTADLNMAMLRLPGFNGYFEVIEYQNTPGRHTVDPDHFNPRTCHVAVYVDDIEATWSALEATGSELVSTGIVQIPEGRLEGAKVIYCTDPDGIRVEIIESDVYLDGTERAGKAGATKA
jgi:catechol 2,3-dioxygenase-like lactoylglutathione lyase family enzyme